MRLINSRYKINRILSEDDIGSTFLIEDVYLNNTKKILREIKGTASYSGYISYMKNYSSEYKNLVHPNLCALYFFNKMTSIDNKPATVLKYYYTSQVFDGEELFSYCRNAKLEEKFELVFQLISLFKYLHSKGFLLCNFTDEELHVNDNKLLVSSFPYLENSTHNEKIGKDNAKYLPPESKQFSSFTVNSDIYIFGEICFNIFFETTHKEKSFKEEFKEFEEKIDTHVFEDKKTYKMYNIIKKCAAEKILDRYQDLNTVFDDLIKVTNDERDLIDKSIIKKLPKIDVSIRNRRAQSKEIIEKITEEEYRSSICMIEGRRGSGKTVFLNDVFTGITIEGYVTASADLGEESSEDFHLAKSLIIKVKEYATPKLIEKYSSSIGSVFFNIEKEGLYAVSYAEEETEIWENTHKIISEFAKFIADVSELFPIAILIDNIEYIDEKSLAVLYYLFKLQETRICLVFTLNSDIKLEKKYIKDFIMGVKNKERSYSVALDNLSYLETEAFVKELLGTKKAFTPLFEKIFKLTNGSCSMIYDVLRNAINENILSVDKYGDWIVDEDNLEKISRAEEIETSFEDLMSGLSKVHIEILKIISSIRISTPLYIILNSIHESREVIFEAVRDLSRMKILIEIYISNNTTIEIRKYEFKRYIYERIEFDERVVIHKTIVKILNLRVELLDVSEKEELANQMFEAGEKHEVVAFLSSLSEDANKNRNTALAIKYLEQVEYFQKKIEDEESMIKTKLKIANMFESLVEYENALMQYKELDEYAYEKNDLHLGFEVMIRKTQLNILMGSKKQAFKDISEFKKRLKTINDDRCFFFLMVVTLEVLIIAKKIRKADQICEKLIKRKNIKEYPDLYARFICLWARIRIDMGKTKVDDILLLTEAKAILSNTEETREYLKIVDCIGNYYMTIGNYNDAKLTFEEGIRDAAARNNSELNVRFYNNIAVIYRKMDRFSEAVEYFSKAINQKGNEFSTLGRGVLYLNIAILNLQRENLKESNKYREMYEKYMGNAQGTDYLEEYHYRYLCQYYGFLGDSEKSILYSEAADLISKKWGITRNIEGEYYRVLAEIMISTKRNHAREMNLLQLCLEKKDYKLFRTCCHTYAANYLIEKSEKKAREMYDLGMKYSSEFTSDYMELAFDVIRVWLSHEEDRLRLFLDVLTKYDKTDGSNFKRYINVSIADIYFSRKKYKKALMHYSTAFNFLREGMNKIPKENWECYFKTRHEWNIKAKIIEITEIYVSEGKIDVAFLNKLKESEELIDFKEELIKKYFDFGTVKRIINEIDQSNNVEKNAKENKIDKHKAIAGRISESIINQISSNPDSKLYSLLSELVIFCKATNGYIFAFNSDDSLELLAKKGDYKKSDFYENIIEKAFTTQKEVLVEDFFEFAEEEKYMPKDGITSIVCIPFFTEKSASFEWFFDKRKKHKERKIPQGVIIIESDKITNNINVDSVEVCKAQIKLCNLLIENEFLNELVSIDRLTQLFSRKYFEYMINIEIERMRKGNGEFSLIIADVDNFKAVNDSYGHLKGDEILKTVADLVKKSLRKEDICARYGGEEFIILLPGAGLEIAKSIAEKIRLRVESAKLLGLLRPLTISLGVSNFPTHSTRKNELIEKADKALYFAKENGRNQSCVYSSEVRNKSSRIDKVAGIITGEMISDQRRVETILEIARLSKDKKIKPEDRYFSFLGRIIEVSEADYGMIYAVDEKSEINFTGGIISRRKHEDSMAEGLYFNNDIIKKYAGTEEGEYLVDWDNYPSLDKVTGLPDWQSVIIYPIRICGNIVMLLYLSVSLRNKEFNGDVYNFVSTLCEIFST